MEQAIRLVQEVIQDPDFLGEEQAAKNRQALEEAMAGVPGGRSAAVSLVKKTLEECGAEVEGADLAAAAYEIYRRVWGLGPLEELYRDPAVNEIRVNAPDRVYVLRNMKNERAEVRFESDEDVLNLVTRLVMHDRGVALNKSSPTIESMRKDGTRITATCPPVTEHVTLVLRKHIPRALTFEEMIAGEVMDSRTADLIRLLVRGRANMLVVGGVGSGKTTQVRTYFSEVDRNARVIVLETDRELFLAKNYPDMDIVEMEEHPEANRTLAQLFRIVLRYSPTTIIVGEFRGQGEAREAVRACERGHDGSMATAHFGSPAEAVSGTARLLIEEGLNLPQKLAEQMVAAAFNVVVKMFGDPTRGIIRLESVTEVISEGNRVVCRDLVRWVTEEEGSAKGEWRVVGAPSERLVSRLARYGVRRADLEAVFK